MKQCSTCRWAFTTAFPINVAPKKVQKGTRKFPQMIPARSNRGFGTFERKSNAYVNY